MTSWKSSLIGKTLLRLLYVYVLFYFCSKVKRTKAAIGAMVVDFLTEGKTRRVQPERKNKRARIVLAPDALNWVDGSGDRGDLAVLQRDAAIHAEGKLVIVRGNHR